MKQSFLYSEEDMPSYRCPTCDDADMMPVGEVSNRQSEARTGGDIRVMLRSDLMCQNDKCSEVGIMVMLGEVYSDGETEPELLFKPTYVNPAPNMCSLRKEYPWQIRTLLEQVFLLFWTDLASSGNKLRIAVEELLTQQGVDLHHHDNGVPRLNKNGYPTPIMLHERLRRFKGRGKVESKCVSALEAIKWLGNDSSHAGEHVFENVLYQAIMVFSAVMEQLYLGVELPKELEFSIQNINFFHNPNKQNLRPKK